MCNDYGACVNYDDEFVQILCNDQNAPAAIHPRINVRGRLRERGGRRENVFLLSQDKKTFFFSAFSAPSAVSLLFSPTDIPRSGDLPESHNPQVVL